MERKNILNKILAIVCLLAIVLPSFSEVLAVTTDMLGQTKETSTFGISFLNANGWGYRIQDRNTYRVYESKGSTKDYSRSLYCLDMTKKFPGEDSGKTTFESTGDLDSTIKNKDKVRLIAENMYLPSMSDEEKDAVLAKMFERIISETQNDANPVTIEYIKKTLNEDDIVFAQQSAIWKYTNDLSWQGTSIWMSDKENPSSNEWYQVSNIGQARYEFMKEIYEYLVSDNLKSESTITNPSLEKKTKTSTETEDGYIVGPFYVKSGTNTNYSVVLKDQSGATLTNYKLVDKDGNRLSTTLNNTLDKDFYVLLPLKTQTTKVVLELSYSKTETTTKLWTNGESTTQPILEVIKTPVPGSDKDEAIIEKPEKIYDLALRKYIVKVGDTEITDRTPKVYWNEADQEINYKHKKDPVVLKAGDTVIYNITVYNEGNQKGIATRVKDYLPEGLEFVKGSDLNRQYGWIASQDGSYIVTAYTKNYELDPFDQATTKISSVTVQVECKVKENVTSGILTNIAEIAEDNIDDIDSTPSTMNPTQEELPDYTGKDSNKEDLSDSDYFYRGQEDDDDFEKVTVEEPKQPELDLALRKYIQTVNGTNKNREPVVDVSKLKDGTSTTATYTHSKEPVKVEQGDIVIYTIRVYNEGEVDAYANEITDYLPTGLGFLVNHKVNYTNGWTVADGQTPTTVKLNSIPNAVQNTLVSDFQGIENLNDVDVIKGKVSIKTNKLQYGNTDNLIEKFDTSKNELSSKTVQVACVVLDKEAVSNNLRNIAAITDEVDENGNHVDKTGNSDGLKDRDSEPNEIDTDNYPDNKNIQDDDDYERLVLEPKDYDLALKKFITQVEGKDVPTRMIKVDTTTLKAGDKDATYTMDKSLVSVKTGDTVTYTIRVYNEGEIDAYATEIKDNIPEGLEYIENSEINKQYRWKIEDGKLVTDYLSEEVSKDNVIKAFNKENGEISYKEVKVEFKVVSKKHEAIVNIAEIKDDDGDDRDSTPDNDKPEEDDQDYDNVIPESYDLALKKFITQVEGKDVPTRMQNVDTTPLVEGKDDATYTMDKSVVKVKVNNTVTYTIRVYNEGQTDAYATEIKDNIPEGLEYIEDSEINKQYRWQVKDGKVITDYLSEEVSKDNVIKAFNAETGEISYKEVKIEFKVVSKENKIITNIAEIKEDDGDDKDSTPDNDNPSEDDQDYDNIVPETYDLALQKFITKLNDTDVTSRTPLISLDENGKIVYTHTNEPLTVTNQSVITYTIRVYNEGTVEANVEEIKDNIPNGLVYLPENEINQKYGWKLYDKDGNETEKIEDAVEIRTDYLSKEKSAERNENNTLKPFDKDTEISNTNPDYRDVEVAFQVDQSKLSVSDRKIKNIAEISKDDGDDDDSTPDNDNPDEDDIDDEEVILKNFDLSLLKYVTKVTINEDGVVKEIATGHTGLENPEPVVKVELNKKKLDKTTVIFGYTIKITNEGEIEGYAKEIKDRIPEGLEFFKEDNPDWEIVEDGVVTTTQLANTLLKPGESATVTINLRWKNAETNMGLKVNTAEISKDENEYNVPDIDSTPDNNVDGEDDQDTAPVILSIITGSAQTYIILTITVITILSTGFYAIKKYVL